MLFLGEFEGLSVEEAVEKIACDYQVSAQEVEKFDLICLWQDEGGYEGSSWFLLKDKETGKFFENSGGHCSCYGFEGQFEPAETSVEYLHSDKFYLPYDAPNVVKELINNL